MRFQRTLPVLLLALAAWSASARAQATLSMTLLDTADTNPPHVTVDNNDSPTGQLRLDYSFQQGNYRGATIDLTLPPGVTPMLATTGTFTTFQCGTLGVSTADFRHCQWVVDALALDQQGLSGTVNLTFRLDRWRFVDQQPSTPSAQLSALYTGLDGNPEHVIATNAATYTLIADASAWPVWQSPTGFGVIGWTTRTIGDETDNGLLLRLYSRPTNGHYGSARMRDLVVSSTFGDGLEILSYDAQDDWNTPVMTPGATTTEISTTHAGAAPPDDTFNDSHYDTGIISTDVFVPCSALAAGVEGESYAVHTVASWIEYRWNGAGAYIEVERTMVFDAQVPTGLGTCGTGGGVTKGNEWTPIPEDGIGLTGVSVTTPNGVASASNVLIVDALPPGVEFAGFHTRSPAEFAFYACTFNDKIGEDVTLQYFNDHRLTSCTLLGYPTGHMPATHLVAYAATWGGGSEPLQPFAMRYQTYAPIGYLAAHPWQGDPPAPPRNVAFAKLDYVLNEVAVEARPNMAVSVDADPWRADAEVRVVANSACTQSWGEYDGPTVLSPRTPGLNRSKVRLYPNVSTAGSRLRDPQVTVAVPEGVNVISTEVVFHPEWGCTGVTLTSAPAAGTVIGPATLSWQFAGLEPGIGPAARCYDVVVEFETSPNGWRNNESFSIVGTVDGPNASAACNKNYAFNQFRVTMPAELRVEVEPTCQGNSGEPAFDITARNNGGDDFTDAVLTFPVPADTWVTSIEAPGGVTLACDFGSGLEDCVGDLSDVQEIVASGFDLDAPDQAVTVRVNLGTNLASLTQITAGASASVNELSAPANSGVSNPFVVDDCHWEIEVTKFFDADKNGKETQGDARIPSWTFTIANADGSPTEGATETTVQTDDNGVAHFFVLPGDYKVSEVMPEVVNGQVWSAFQGQTSQTATMTIDPEGPVQLLFANSCSCEAFQCASVAGACTLAGCTYVDEPDCAAAPVYWIPLRSPSGETSTVRCTVDSTQQPPQLVCDAPNTRVQPQCHAPEVK